MRVPPVPSRARRILANGAGALDRVQQAANLPRIARVLRSDAAIAYDGWIVERHGAALAWMTLGGHETQQGRLPHPQVQMIVDGRVTYRVGRARDVVAEAGELVYVPNDVDVTLDREPGRYCNWLVPVGELAAELAGPGDPRDCRFIVPLLRIAAADADRRVLEDLLDVYARSFDGADPPRSRPVAAWLARALERCAPITRLSAGSVARLARLDAWLDRHLHEPIALPDLCAVAGCGERALQKLVRARYGLTPMGYVRQRRLAVVREKLTADRRCRVTDVALDAGINHLGRLAQAYRAMFGESPADTRRHRGASNDDVDLEAPLHA